MRDRYWMASSWSALVLFCTYGCTSGDGEDPCAAVSMCPAPQAPALSPIHPATLEWSHPCYPGDSIQVGSSEDLDAGKPDTWINTSSFDLSGRDLPYAVKLFARIVADDCAKGEMFSFVYQVVAQYPPEPGEPGSTALAMDDEAFAAWAKGWVEPVDYGEDVLDTWRTPGKATGPATGKPKHVVTLGRGGEIVMTFDPPIRDGEGDDLAVFENASAAGFLELAFVEVSSDGEAFVRFDGAYLGESPVGEFGTHDTRLIGSLAGKYPAGWGAPFDLAALRNKQAVADGTVDLDHIGFVKIVDVVGDGSQADSFGNPIYDPYPAAESAGFDLEAVGVIHN